MEQIKMKNKIIIGELVFLILIITAIYVFYPKVDYDINGEVIRFNSINSDVVIFSESPDFSNPRYINFENEETYVRLDPGKYYWKAANNFVKGFKNEIEIDSEVGLEIDRDDEDAEIKNIGNVKINITKTDDGITIGHIILDPLESEKIEDIGEYTGREEK